MDCDKTFFDHAHRYREKDREREPHHKDKAIFFRNFSFFIPRKKRAFFSHSKQENKIQQAYINQVLR